MQDIKSFGFRKIPNPPQRWEQISRSQIRIFLLSTFFFLLGVNLLNMISLANTTQEKLLDNGNLKDIAAQLRGFQPELSRGLIAVDRIIHNQINKTVSKYTQQDRESLRQILVNNTDTLQTLLGNGSDKLIETLSFFAAYQQDWKSLLGFSQPQTYLIILQNTSEKRPNGGFFGSFIKVVVDRGVIASFNVIDSYVPQVLQPDTFIMGPDWIDNFLPEREIFFVGANKIGFSYHDGANIKKLYERAYIGEKVRGVLFLRTDMITKIMPELQEKLWEWQFGNASIDLIRGEARSGKKELYLEDFSRLLDKEFPSLIKGFLKQADSLIQDHAINLYLTDISGPLHNIIRNGYLTTRFEEDTMYFRDSNISYNKIDQFIQKTIRFYNQQGDVVKESQQDIVSIKDLSPGKYHITIQYSMQVHQYYEQLIGKFASDYEISLGERELHILGLTHERSTRGVIYSSKKHQISGLSGNIYHQALFSTPFSKNAYYKTKIKGNGLTNVVELQLDLK